MLTGAFSRFLNRSVVTSCFLLLFMGIEHVGHAATAGNCFHSKALDEHIELNSVFPDSNNWTLECWVKPDVDYLSETDGGQTETSVLFSSGGGRPQLKIEQVPHNYFYGRMGISIPDQVRGGNLTDLFFDASSPVKGFWTHLAFVRQGDLLSLYVNGVKDPQEHDVSGVPFQLTRIGDSTNSFLGQVDEVRYWNISKNDVSIIENMGASLVGDEPGLIRYYRMDESGAAQGTVVVDSTATGSNASLQAGEFVASALNLLAPPLQGAGNAYHSITLSDQLKFDAPVTNTTSPWTLECWVNSDVDYSLPASGTGEDAQEDVAVLFSLDGGFPKIMAEQFDGSDNSNLIGISVDLTSQTRDANGNFTFNASSPAKGVWTHLAFVYSEQGILSLYVNGVKDENEFALTGPFNFDSIGDGLKGFKGKVEEFRFWEKALAETEVYSNMRFKMLGTEESLTRYYRFDTESGETITADRSPSGIDAQIISGDVDAAWITSDKRLNPIALEGMGNVLSFNNGAIINNDKVTLDSDISVIGDWTTEFWVKRGAGIGEKVSEGVVGGSEQIIKLMQPATAVRVEGDYRVGITYGETDHYFTAKSPLVGEWTHLAFVNDSAGLRLYVNGEVDSTVLPTTDLGISALGGEGSFFGELEEFRIWSKAVTVEEIQNLKGQLVTGNEDMLEVYYRFDQLSGEDRLHDYSYGSYHGTLENFSDLSACWIPSDLVNEGPQEPVTPIEDWGHCLEFDGVDDEVTTISGDLGSKISILAWIKPHDLSGDKGIVAQDTKFAFKTLGTKLRFTTPGKADHTSLEAGLQANVWQHVAVTFDPGQVAGVKFYVNGAFVSSGDASSINQLDGPLRFGNNQYDELFAGEIDEVSIWSTVLNSEEVSKYHFGVVSPDADNLFALYSFDDFDTPDVLNDLGPNGLLGTLTNMDTAVAWQLTERVLIDTVLGSTGDTELDIYWDFGGITAEPFGYIVTVSANADYFNPIVTNVGVVSNLTVSLGKELVDGDLYFVKVEAYGETVEEIIGGVDEYVFVTPLPAIAGKAIDFDGLNRQAVKTNSVGFLDSATAVTISCWANIASGSSATSTLFAVTDGTVDKLIVTVDPATGSITVGNGTVDTEEASGVFASDVWNHFALVMTSSSTIFYVNGDVVIKVNDFGFGATNSLPFVTGGTGAVDGKYLKGQMDDVTVWTRGLGITDVRSIVHQNLPDFVVDSSASNGLALAWNFENVAATSPLIIDNIASDTTELNGTSIGDADPVLVASGAVAPSSPVGNNVKPSAVWQASGASHYYNGLTVEASVLVDNAFISVAIDNPSTGTNVDPDDVIDSPATPVGSRTARTWYVDMSRSGSLASQDVKITIDLASITGEQALVSLILDSTFLLYKENENDSFEVMPLANPVYAPRRDDPSVENKRAATFTLTTTSGTRAIDSTFKSGYYALGYLDDVLTPAIGLDAELSLSDNGTKVIAWTVESEAGVTAYIVKKKVDGEWIEIKSITGTSIGTGSYSVDVDWQDGDIYSVVAVIDGVEQSYPIVDNGEIQTLYLNEGWNMLSVNLEDADLSELVSEIEGAIWRWTGSEYSLVTEVAALEGFWVYSDSVMTVDIVGSSITTRPVELQAGWTLCGPANACKVPQGVNVWSWENEYNQIAVDFGEIVTGRGYWFFSTEAKTLNLGNE